MVAARPAVDAYLLELLSSRTFTRREVAETTRGICRVNPPLSHALAETAPRWAEAIAPATEAITHLLASGQGSRIKRVSTPLTGANRSARYEGKRGKAATRSRA